MNRSLQKEQLLQELSDTLLNPQSPTAERTQARYALARLVDPLSLALLLREAMASDSQEVVTEVLALTEAKRSLGEAELMLVGFLYDASPEVRRQALRLLGERGSAQMLVYVDDIIAASLKETSIFGPEDLAAANEARQKLVERTGGEAA